MPIPKVNNFIFSPSYRVLRHGLFWSCWLLGWTCFWTLVGAVVTEIFVRVALYIPVFIIYSYPVSHFSVPTLLLKGKYLTFLCFIISWIVVGWYLNIYFLNYLFIPALEMLNLHNGNENTALGFHCMSITVACFSALSLLKHWIKKQQAWLLAEREKITAQLQLLKAQLHPHFLFNTLNNIYSFALESSPKTPQMVLKLSSLLSYMLYECKTDEVLLEKEVEVMKDYIGLEKERYGDKIDISVNIEGDIQDKFITPLLILPFLENAFKHGTSEQLERPWMSVDIAVKGNTMKCKVVNSKNEFVPYHEDGVGVNNVKERLKLLYPEKHELKLSDEGQFFVVSLLLELRPHRAAPEVQIQSKQKLKNVTHEVALPVDR
jgi:two-component system, LytTR family, sensor histidine kinase AlgZ